MTKTKPSKSALKREYHALQQLGEQLIGLKVDELAAMELDETLCDAVLQAKQIKSHGALRRQKQLIGKLMRDIDPAPIRSALTRLQQQDDAEKASFRSAEQWRDRIADDGGTALEAFFEHTGARDAELESLVRELGSTRHAAGRKRIRRLIFRRVMANIE